MSTELTKRDTLVHHEEHDRELTRVIMICLDDDSAETTFNWAQENFIAPHKDLVSSIMNHTGGLTGLDCVGECTSSGYSGCTLY